MKMKTPMVKGFKKYEEKPKKEVSVKKPLVKVMAKKTTKSKKI